MPWIAAAVVGSALIGGASSYAGGQAQANAANNSAQLQDRQFQQTRQDLAPWRQSGVNALSQINDLMGLGGSGSGTNAFAQPQQQGPTPGMIAAQAAGPHSHGLNTGNLLWGVNDPFSKGASPIQDIAAAQAQGIPITDAQWAQAGYGPGGSAPGGAGQGGLSATSQGLAGGVQPMGGPGSPGVDAATAQNNAFAKFRTDPGYQFAYDEGSRALQSSAAARGILNSGATAKALTRYGQGVADQQYGNYFARLQSLAGIGQTATNQTANYGAQSAANQGNAFMAAGNARASAYGGAATSANQGIQNYLTYNAMRQPSYATFGNGNWTPGPEGFPV